MHGPCKGRCWDYIRLLVGWNGTGCMGWVQMVYRSAGPGKREGVGVDETAVCCCSGGELYVVNTIARAYGHMTWHDLTCMLALLSKCEKRLGDDVVVVKALTKRNVVSIHHITSMWWFMSCSMSLCFVGILCGCCCVSSTVVAHQVSQQPCPCVVIARVPSTCYVRICIYLIHVTWHACRICQSWSYTCSFPPSISSI